MTDVIEPDAEGNPAGLQALASYVEPFASSTFKVGAWKGAEPLEAFGQMPYFEYSPTVVGFIHDAAKHRWMLPSFDWPKWKETQEFHGLCTDPAQMASATSVQLFKLITAFLRQDRFAEGSLVEPFENGVMLRIAQRARDIASGKE